MIVPMEKLTVLVFHKGKERFLSALQGLGLIHVALDICEATSDEVNLLTKEIETCKKYLKQTVKIRVPAHGASQHQPVVHTADPLGLVESYHATCQEIETLTERIEKHERTLRNLEPWGRFDRAMIARLRSNGITIRFFVVPIKKFDALALDDVYYQEISRDRTYVYFVVFERNEAVTLDADEFFYPKTDFDTLQATCELLKRSRDEKKAFREALAVYRDKVQTFIDERTSSLDFKVVNAHLKPAADATVYIINGWLPRGEKEKTEQFLDAEGVYYFFARPEIDEAVPVLLKNNRFSRLFEAVTKLFDLPHYAELDLTPFFAPFFTLFFGLCLGDAGYGLVLAIAAFMLRKKVAPAMKDAMMLVTILGLSTFVCGMIGGVGFGYDLSQIEQLKAIVLFDQDRLFVIAITLGVIQVLFGMILQAANRVRQYGFLAGVSTMGWIVLLLGLIGMTINPAAKYAAFFGITLILFFNDMKVNIFMRIGKGLWELYGITGVFGDVLSYIRLFALGISSAILGFVVNDMAMQFRTIPVVGFFVAFLILLIGHTGNMLLGALSAFVHPLRLTFVEFYKSAGFAGGGKAYKPFRRANNA